MGGRFAGPDSAVSHRPFTNRQARRSVLSGRLGDWIPLGGADLDDAEGATGLIARTRPGGLPRLLVRVTSASPAGP